MNERKAEELLLDDITFDRLVDGELSASEYRSVLAALEQQPAAWRKCAEAFLQAQAWQREMKDVRATAETKPAAKPSTEVAPRTSTTNDWLRMLLVAAASFLLAFFAAQQFWQAAANRPLPSVPPIARASEEPVDPHTTNTATGNQPLGNVQLAVNRTGSEEPQFVNVPVYDPEAATEMLRLLGRPA